MSERMNKHRGGEPREPREPTPEQAMIAKIDFFLSMRKTLSTVVNNHVQTLPNWSDMTKKQHKETRFMFLDGMLNEYIIQRYTPGSEQVVALERNGFTNGNRKTCQELLNKDNLLNILKSREELYDKTAGEYTNGDIFDITIKAFFDLRKASSEQREVLFKEAGYTPDQHIGQKIGIAAKDTALMGGGAWIAEPVGGAAAAFITPDDFGDISDPKTLIAVGVSYILHYSAAVYNAIKNHQSLKDQDINTCPNLWSTLLYLLLQKFHPRLADISVYLGTLGPTLAQELIVAPILLLPGGGAAVMARNVIGAGIFGGVARFIDSEAGRKHLRGGR